MDLRRVLLFFALSLLCIYAYGEIVRRYYGPPARRVSPPPVATKEQPATAPAAPAIEQPAVPPVATIEGRRVVVDTDLFTTEWTTAGARMTSFRLKRYRTTTVPDSPPLELLHGDGAVPGNLGIRVDPVGLDDAVIPYQVDRETLELSGEATGAIVFRGRATDGTEIEKEIRFGGNVYPMEMLLRVRGASLADSTASIALAAERTAAPKGGFFGGDRSANTLNVVALDGRRLSQHAVSSLSSESVEFSQPVWAGFGDRYFITVMIPGVLEGAHGAASSPADTDVGIVRIEEPLSGETPEASVREARVRLYFGPKDLDTLAAAGPELSRAVDFGLFWFVAMPLHWCLVQLHGISGNYGLDIIILSALIKILFLPLTRKSMESMRAMQKLQPEMTKVRERYKDDAQRQQKEMMELYRRHRVNPLSGCLPMLLQLPVFVGLYNTLLNAIELRHAPFVWWIKDLSSPERLHIAGVGVPMLAVAMGASMLLQQWTAPAAGDPAQRRMMMFMPVIFTFMFINFPSGLVLYWLVNNVLTIVQQHYVLRTRTAQ